jgi:hypothetical protein
MKYIAFLHDGELLLANRTQGGFAATLVLPRSGGRFLRHADYYFSSMPASFQVDGRLLAVFVKAVGCVDTC